MYVIVWMIDIPSSTVVAKSLLLMVCFKLSNDKNNLSVIDDHSSLYLPGLVACDNFLLKKTFPG